MVDKSSVKDAARHRCLLNGVTLTPLREEVLDLVLNYEGIVKAYSVLNEMQQLRGQVAPPTVYRALDFWVEQGILHKVAAVNGYMLCQHDHQHADHHMHQAMILLCERCGEVEERTHFSELDQLKAVLAQQGFLMTAEHLVLTGVCKTCQKN